jgi:hypothetical protein
LIWASVLLGSDGIKTVALEINFEVAR